MRHLLGTIDLLLGAIDLLLLQQDMFNAIVDNPLVHRATRAHFRAAKQLGAGAVLGIDLIRPDVELHAQAGSTRHRATSTTPRAPSPLRRAAPAWALERSASTTARGCLGASRATSARRESRAHAVALRAPQRHALGRVQIWRLAMGHTSLSTHVADIARAFGASAKVME